MPIFFFIALINCRSPFRPKSSLEPSITAQWTEDEKSYTLVNSHLQEGPYFNLFDRKHFFAHLLPAQQINYRQSYDKMVQGTILSALIEKLLKEVRQKKTYYEDFIILKQRDFNTHDQTGLIIAKFKHYPFVVKLFIETPKSFVEPLSKGFETSGLFMLGGGVTRHLSGFTRIKNLEYLQRRILSNPYWKNRIAFPRKWFWLPEDAQWIEVIGKNMGPERERSINIPAIYALICDYIDVERMFSLKNANDRHTAMNLSNFLCQQIDPHINNYAVEKITHKIIPIDTEHFPTMVGYSEPPPCTSYLQWYSNLGLKMIKDTLARGKPHRRTLQAQRHWPMDPFTH